MILTKSERRALLFIIGVLLAGILVKWIIPHEIKKTIYDYSMEDSLFKALSADTVIKDIQTVEINKPLKSTKKKKSKTKEELKEKSIDINTADQKTLERLPQIGPSTANLIIEYRVQNGPFKSIQELDNVKRIGPKTLEKIAPYIFIELTTDSLKPH